MWKKLKGLLGDDKHYYGNQKICEDMRLIFRIACNSTKRSSEIANHVEALLSEFEELYSVWVEHTSITNFNEILKKLPVLPVEWVDDEDDTKDSNIRMIRHHFKRNRGTSE